MRFAQIRARASCFILRLIIQGSNGSWWVLTLVVDQSRYISHPLASLDLGTQSYLILVTCWPQSSNVFGTINRLHAADTFSESFFPLSLGCLSWPRGPYPIGTLCQYTHDTHTSIDVMMAVFKWRPTISSGLIVEVSGSDWPRYDWKTYERPNKNDNFSWPDWWLFSGRCYSCLCCACCGLSRGVCAITLGYLNSWWFAASDHSASSRDPCNYGDVAMNHERRHGEWIFRADYLPSLEVHLQPLTQ